MYRLPFILTSCILLIGCQSVHTPWSQPFQKASKTQHDAVPKLNANFNYKRLTLNGKVFWLAQGAVDHWAVANTQVYYSADRNVFKWANGRLHSVNNGQTQWREHQVATINWQDFPKLQKASFTRQIDQTDGKHGVLQKRHIQVVPAPAVHAYVGNTADLIWLHEYSDTATNAKSSSKANDDIWYAISRNNPKQPIYAQQCIAKNQCLTWQDWSVSK